MASLRDLVVGDANVTVGSLCTGYGGLDLGLLAALGRGRIAWVADCDPHVGTILAARMRGVPNLGDLRRIDWSAVEPVDVVTAGFPCQDISAAGRRAGIEKGERSGIWTDIMAGVRVLRPTLLIVENVAALRWKNGGLDRVLGDLAEAGYDAFWRSVRASDIGAAHRRERIFLLAWSRLAHTDAADTDRARWQLQRHQCGEQTRRPFFARPTAVAADTDGGGFSVGGDSDCAPLGPSDSEGVRHLDGLRTTAAYADGDKSERRRGDKPLARSSRTAPPAEDQRQRHGDAAFDRGPVAEQVRGPQRLAAGVAAVDPEVADHSKPGIDWGEYAAAVRRWEVLLGRDIPFPTQPGQRGRQVLSPAFVEHLMGLPAGWVTDLPLPRTAQLRALGNGVVPQQAAYALTLLLADLAELLVGGAPIRHGQEAAAA